MAINPNTDFTAGAILTADQMNRLPRGIMGFVSRNTTYQPTSTASDLFSLTFTAVAGRYYKYTFFSPGIDSSGALAINGLLTDASNVSLNVAGQQLYGPAQQFPMNFVTIRTESAGSITRKIRMQTSSGNANMFGTTAIGFFLVEDIGEA